jgi:predicted CXXCH cytochrome family protein
VPRAAIGLGAALIALIVSARMSAAAEPAPGPSPSASATYVGSETCVPCHGNEVEAWRGSDHDLAMQPATPHTALGDFAHGRLAADGVVSTFYKRAEALGVHTAGPGGKLADFPITYTFGVRPLQQYLIPLAGGRLQALGIAWDTRAKGQGGQRWFDLYPEWQLAPGDPLHWTGIDQNWNYQCADCHSTALRKGYDAQSATYATTWSELSVGCEACHGPASNHVAWAKQDAATRPAGDVGLTVRLDERRGAHWTIDAATGNAIRATPRVTRREIETCGRCHARRGQFSDDWRPGEPLGDAFRVALLDPGLYYPDGQQRDEVYTYGSFLQSLMYARGVTCSDCHEPHAAKLRAVGNSVCVQCHAPSKYDAAAHTHHAAGSAGAQCASCHMPARTYMLIDPRHDHGFRVPRPDRTAAFGAPNPCTGCHAKQSPGWAADAIARWFPQRRQGFQTFAEGLHAGDIGAPGAQDLLTRIATDHAQSPIARASAVQRLGGFVTPRIIDSVGETLGDTEPLVRAAAVRALAQLPAPLRVQLLPSLLADPVREVRIEAARALAGDAEPALPQARQASFDRALAECVASERFNADRPEGQSALGDLAARRGRTQEAEAAYRKALEIDPTFEPAALNLADLQRAAGHDDEAERILRAALGRAPRSAPAHYALGLALVRQKHLPEALAELRQAVTLAPDEARFAHTYAIAQHDTGAPADALATLRAALQRVPYDRPVLLALINYEREAGDLDQVRTHARLLRQLEPDDPNVARLVETLDAKTP